MRVVDEPVTVVVSLKGWVRALKGHEVDAGAARVQGRRRALRHVRVPQRRHAARLRQQRAASTRRAVAQLPSGRGDGQPITSLIDLEAGTQPAHYFAGAAAQTLLLAGTGGFGLLARVGDLVARQRGGKGFLSLEGDEKPLPPAPWSTATTRVACLSLAGRLLVFALDELKLQPNGGRGLTLMDLDAKDALVERRRVRRRRCACSAAAAAARRRTRC